MPDLLLEVLSEEIPARMQGDGGVELRRHVLSRLEGAGLSPEGEEYFVTPRRLALLVRGLPDVQPDIPVERKGPRVEAPERAIAGFLKSTGLTLEDCEQRETPKGPVWFAVTQRKGRPTADLLAELLPTALAAVSWPKSMRWDESGVRWVRPIRSILCLLDDAVVPFCFGTVESGRTTLGHRFLSSGTLTVADTDDYEEMLERANVMLDLPVRADKIEEAAKALAREEALKLPVDQWLLRENAGLVEWPVVRLGTIDERFMDLPPEVLRSAMRKHQRYFGLIDKADRQAPRFVMVADIETENDCAVVVAGNERVLRARLSDARFFWDQDRRRKLEDYLPRLEGVVFHARLGSMSDKTQRVERLARSLFDTIRDANPDWAVDADPKDAARAGRLCKADLVTEMVGEFPDLQGIMGRYYAEADGEAEAVYKAIATHYAPRGLEDLPSMPPAGIALALADKLDTLAGFFAIDERPTGSKDPFALRRAAVGVIRLIVVNKLRLPLVGALDDALDGYAALLPQKLEPATTRQALLAFIADRFKVIWRQHGVRHELVSAIFGVDGENDLVRMLERLQALSQFLESEDGANLLTAYRRAANILRIEEKKDGRSYYGRADPTLFTDKEEQVLHTRITDALFRADTALGREDFEEAMESMATLRAPVDAFFDNVTVNCEEPELRSNRLLMLSAIRATLDRVADFSKIEG